MNLFKIEKSPDKEDILLLLTRLENDGVTHRGAECRRMLGTKSRAG